MEKVYLLGGIYRGEPVQPDVRVCYCDRCGMQTILHRSTLEAAKSPTILCFFCGMEQMAQEKNPDIRVTAASRKMLEEKFGKGVIKKGMKKIKEMAKHLRESKGGVGG